MAAGAASAAQVMESDWHCIECATDPQSLDNPLTLADMRRDDKVNCEN